MKKLTAFIIAIILILSMTGCNISFDSHDLMCPPNPTGEQAIIQKLISKASNNNYQLVYPNAGEYRNSIITYDLDNDEIKEAIAFYQSEDGIHALFLSKNKNSYEIIENYLFDAKSIDRVSFADLDGDEVKEILIGINKETVLNNLLAFRFLDTVNEISASQEYSTLITGDFTKDRCDDVLTIILGSGSLTSLLSFNSESLEEISTSSFDSDITKITNLTYGIIDSSNYGAIIDGINTSNEYTSQIFYFDKSSNSLKNPLFDMQGYSQTRRTIQVFSQDIDNDQIVEIPICTSMEATSNENTEGTSIPTQISWENYNTSQMIFVPKKKVIYCQDEGYMFAIPEIWVDTITARYSQKEREMKIYSWEYIDGALSTTDELLSIKTFNKNDFDNEKGSYIEITRNNAYVYAYSIPNNENYMLISGEEIVNNFSLATNK